MMGTAPDLCNTYYRTGCQSCQNGRSVV